jgi:hypothetical protein
MENWSFYTVKTLRIGCITHMCNYFTGIKVQAIFTLLEYIHPKNQIHMYLTTYTVFYAIRYLSSALQP